MIEKNFQLMHLLVSSAVKIAVKFGSYFFSVLKFYHPVGTAEPFTLLPEPRV